MDTKETDRIENPVVREYLYNFVPEKLNSNPIFIKVFGEEFASKRLRAELLTVYTNESVGPRGYAGLHTSSDKSITLCKANPDDTELLTPNDIFNNIETQEIAVHECVHAIFERTSKECKKYGLVGGTGLLERYAGSELGRGLNEGFTEWMCEKAGYKTQSYAELTNFIRLIEASVGTERTMELGKGNIRNRFPEILNLELSDVYSLLSKADALYNADNQIRVLNGLESVLSNKLFPTPYTDVARNDEQYKKYLPYIEAYKVSAEFVTYANEQKLDRFSDKVLFQWLKYEFIPSKQKIKNCSIIEFESELLDKFFMKDLNYILQSGENITREDYKKLNKIVSLLNTSDSVKANAADYINGLEKKPSSIVLKEEFKTISKNYLKKFAKEEAERYKNGELSIIELIKESDELFNNKEVHLGREFLRSFATNAIPEFSTEMENIFENIQRNLDRHGNLEEILGQFENATMYRLVPKDKSQDISTSLILGKSSFFNTYMASQDIIRTPEEEYEFDFTADQNSDNAYQVALDNFDALKKEVFAKNPQSEIYIISEEIVVNDDGNCTFYHINSNGEFTEMAIESEVGLKFAKPEKEKNNQVVVPEVKVGKFASFINNIKKKWNQFKNRNIPALPNYIENESGIVPGKIQFSKRPEINKMDSYRVEDFDERLKASREANSTTEQNIEQEQEQDRGDN